MGAWPPTECGCSQLSKAVPGDALHLWQLISAKQSHLNPHEGWWARAQGLRHHVPPHRPGLFQCPLRQLRPPWGALHCASGFCAPILAPRAPVVWELFISNKQP